VDEATRVDTSAAAVVVADGTVNAMVNVDVAPTATVPTAHVRVLPPVQVMDDEAKVVPAGTGTETSTPSAPEGPPLFCTATV
jgi:hypothetical protein